MTRVLETMVAERGAPEAMRCDNGPEFTSQHFLTWALEKKIAVVHMNPASRCKTRMWKVSTGSCAMNV